MRIFRAVPALLLIAALGACDEGLLDVLPQDEIAEDVAITDLESAQAALLGAYSALQSGAYYGGDFTTWVDLLSDDVEHTGTFGSYGQGDALLIPADNGVVNGMWTLIYRGIFRANTVMEKVEELELDDEDRDRIIGEALALRALHHFNAVRLYGDAPVVTSVLSVDEASSISRSPTADVYAQIETDLANAATRLASGGVTNDTRTFVTPGFVDALLAQVHVYQQDWAAAETAAMRVVNSGDHDLAGSYADLFEADGAATAEDIFRVEFAAIDPTNHGYYYQFAGRFEIGATQEIFDLFDQVNDDRFGVTIGGVRPDGIEVVKYPTTTGTEDIHVIRYADVLLLLAEAHAQQGELAQAVGRVNEVRNRAGLADYNLVLDLNNDQGDVLDAIFLERRLELAFEGHRWFDIVRSGRAAAAIDPALDDGAEFAPFKALLPIPQGELDVAANLTQNPGY